MNIKRIALTGKKQKRSTIVKAADAPMTVAQDHVLHTGNKQDHNTDKHIINDQKLKYRKRTIIETFFLSIVNIVLMVVGIVCTIVLWGGTSWYFYLHLFTPENIKKTTISMLLFFGVLGIIVFLVLFLWQQYNYHTYGKLNRRKFPRSVTVQDMAAVYQTSSAEIESVRKMRSVSLIKDDGNIILFDKDYNSVTVKPPIRIDFR